MDESDAARNRPFLRHGKKECYVLFGVGTSFAADYLDPLAKLGVEIAAGILTTPPQWSLRGIPVVLHPEEISTLLRKLPVVLCVLMPKFREAAHQHAVLLGFTEFPAILDPTSVAAASIHTGCGVFINANATLGAEVELDDFVTVNRAASIGHHTVVEAFSTVGPGATVASQCRIGKRVMIGAGAVVAPSLKVADDATVAAGAVVFRDVEAGATVMGNPARVARAGTEQT